MRKKYLEECSTIEDHCRYNAETHHIIASDNKGYAFKFQVVPAIITAFLVTVPVVGQKVPQYWGALTLLSSVITAIGNIANPLKEYYDHLIAAKSFTAIKHEARALRDVFSINMSEQELNTTVKCLDNRYCDVARTVPPTNDSAFAKAEKRIKSGVHDTDI